MQNICLMLAVYTLSDQAPKQPKFFIIDLSKFVINFF